MGTRAAPKPSQAEVGAGPDGAGPLEEARGRSSPPRIRAPSAPIFEMTRTFSSRLPGFAPSTLTAATTVIAAALHAAAFEAARPIHVRAECANVTATAARPPPRTTRSEAQPNRNPSSG